jgi:hypothetical protein
VPATEEERRIMERKDRAETSAAVMIFVLLLVGPMALTAVAIAIVHRHDG